MTADLQWLLLTLLATALMGFPYVLDRIAVRGLFGAMANPSPNDTPQHNWAIRAQKAHGNAVENLIVFAPAVLLVHALGLNNKITAMACFAYFAARVAHYVIYTLGIPVLRTLAFFVGWGATIVLLARAGGLL